MKKKEDSPALKLAKKLGFKSIFEHEVSLTLTSHKLKWCYEPKDKIMSYFLTKRSSRLSCSKCSHNEYNESHKYTPDFYIPKYNLYIESKGYMRNGASVRKKMVALQKQGERIVMLFQSPNLKINPKGKSKTTYAMWAEKSNIPWLDAKDSDWVIKLKTIF